MTEVREALVRASASRLQFSRTKR